MKENSIEEEIKIALDKFLDNKDKDSAILIVEKFILGNYILIRGGRTNIVKDSLRYILSDYKRVLKENEILKKEKEQAWEEWNNLEQGSYETEQKLKQQIKKLQKENKKLKNKLLDTLEGQKVIEEETPQYIKEDYIPKSKLKDIIDRIDYDIKKTKEIISNDKKNNYQITRLKAMNTKSLDIKKRLQELLESEE